MLPGLYFELYQVFILNLFKYFDQKNQIIFIQKCFNTPRPKYDPGGKIFSQGAKYFNNPNLYATDNIRNITTGEGDDYTASCLLDYPYLKEHYKMIEIDLSKQQGLDADPKAM